MAVQQPVAPERIRDILELAALRNTPIALTCRVCDTWQNFRSRFLGLRDGQMWIEQPQTADGRLLPTMDLGAKVGVSFKQRHHKYVFSSAVRETATLKLGPGLEVQGLSAAWPARMHQLQRRMFHRVDVPHDRQVFVDLWEGGLAHEPIDALRDKLIYHAQLIDLSVGGFQVRLIGDVDPRFQAGAPIGATIFPGGEAAPIRVDAQFRHVDPDEFGSTLGLQIVGLNETARGRKMMERIAELTRAFCQGGGWGAAEPPRVHVGC